MKKRILFSLLTALLAGSPCLHAQEQLYTQNFADAPLEMLVDFYNDWVGRTLIIQVDLSKTITLKFSKLTKEEAMIAIESQLAAEGIALVEMGEKFLKVVPIATAGPEGLGSTLHDPDEEYVASDQVISKIIPLHHVVFSDVQPVVQQLLHGYGKVESLERINSIKVTDTSLNISRIVDILDMLDQPLEKIEPRIYQLNHAKAGDIASKLKELVEAARPESSSSTRTTTTAPARTVPGVIRAPRTTTTSVAANSPKDDTQMIQGDVKFVSDDRTNILIVFSKQANFDFFDRIIKVLDVPVDPAVVSETISLEYAEAADIASVLNDFIGAAKAEEEPTRAQTGDTTESGSSRSINDVIAQRAGQRAANTVSAQTESAIGRLSADTKIISDERTNSLLLMGNKSDVEALKSVIAKLDVMLQQVVIEAVILSVGLDNSIQTGVQWVYENQEAIVTDYVYEKRTREVPLYDGNGTVIGTTTEVYDYPVPLNAENLSRGGFDAADLAENMVGGALSYYGFFPDLNVQAILSAAKSDSDARILSTPVVLTTDNTEAKITVADERPVVTSSVTGTSSISARSTYEYKTIGIDLTVTPHISPEKFVLMEITQSADDVGGNVTVDGNEVPIISKREISATVGVKDRETVILGGLVRKNSSESATKIPLLGDIPLLGWLFSSHSKSDDRQELVVLLTPYVLNTPEEARAETKRRVEASDASNSEWPRGWSLSELANDEEDPDAWKTREKEEEPEIWKDWDEKK